VLAELRSGWGRGHAAGLAVGAAAFLGLVLAGYLAHWRWTGFTGNTAWDWLHLLLLPLLVPAVIVPLLRSAMAQRLQGERVDEV
jgi:MFS family permease